MYVTPEQLVETTHKKRPSAQARYLRAHYKGIVLTIRDDGTVALRQEELDRFTLGKQPPKAHRPLLDLSYLDSAR